jgi:hypothetical protein
MCNWKDDPTQSANPDLIKGANTLSLNQFRRMLKEPTPEEQAGLRERLLFNLACLASEALHTRYIINATKDEYLLPEELIENALWSVKRTLCGPGLSDGQSNALEQLMKEIDSDWDIHEIMCSSHWQSTIRLAQQCLRTFGVSEEEQERLAFGDVT